MQYIFMIKNPQKKIEEIHSLCTLNHPVFVPFETPRKNLVLCARLDEIRSNLPLYFSLSFRFRLSDMI